MNLKHHANRANTLADLPSLNGGAGGLLVAKPGTGDLLADQEELDDDVEALVIHMDGTTAEHLFLRAQRHIN
jgi:hypothetical protein